MRGHCPFFLPPSFYTLDVYSQTPLQRPRATYSERRRLVRSAFASFPRSTRTPKSRPCRHPSIPPPRRPLRLRPLHLPSRSLPSAPNRPARASLQPRRSLPSRPQSITSSSRLGSKQFWSRTRRTGRATPSSSSSCSKPKLGRTRSVSIPPCTLPRFDSRESRANWCQEFCNPRKLTFFDRNFSLGFLSLSCSVSPSSMH